MKKKATMLQEETDRRILDKKLLGGDLHESDLEAYLKELPDLAEFAEEIIIE
jgi:hypothetical protein